ACDDRGTRPAGDHDRHRGWAAGRCTARGPYRAAALPRGRQGPADLWHRNGGPAAGRRIRELAAGDAWGPDPPDGGAQGGVDTTRRRPPVRDVYACASPASVLQAQSVVAANVSHRSMSPDCRP